MNNIQIKIIECIKNAHSFSKTLEGTETISREYLVNNLTEFSSTEIPPRCRTNPSLNPQLLNEKQPQRFDVKYFAV